MVFQGARGPCGVPPASPLLSVACSGAPRVFPHVCLPFVSFYPFIFGAKYPHSRAAGPSEPVVICRPLHAVDARPCLPARVWPHNSHCIQYVPIIREREGREGGDKERVCVCVCVCACVCVCRGVLVIHTHTHTHIKTEREGKERVHCVCVCVCV